LWDSRKVQVYDMQVGVKAEIGADCFGECNNEDDIAFNNTFIFSLNYFNILKAAA